MSPTDLAFTRPMLLWLGVPWIATGILMRRRQVVAWRRLRSLVSARFLPRLTRHDEGSLRRYLAWWQVLGFLLLLAASGPTLPGDVEVAAEGGRVLLLLDASASMKATDVEPVLEGDAPEHRFALAQQLAEALVEHLPEHRFALASFSGVAAVKLPMTIDRAVLYDALETAALHSHYQNTGSNFQSALDLALRFASDPTQALQVVLLSDGELMPAEDLDEPVEALRAARVPVHTLSLGSLVGQAREIYEFSDVLAGKKKPAVLSRRTTRRVDAHLRRISEATGGSFAVVAEGVVEELVAAIAARPLVAGQLMDEALRRDVSHWFLYLFVAGGILQRLGSIRPASSEVPAFDLDFLGDQPPARKDLSMQGSTAGQDAKPGKSLSILLLLVLLSGCDSDLKRAHRANQQGIALDRLGQHAAAIRQYQRSRAFDQRLHVPTYNMARSHALAGRHAQAHTVYQEVLELVPDLVEAHYNDGLALFAWGEAERDPEGCQLERTLDLWRRAEERFEHAAELAKGASLESQARANQAEIARLLAVYRALAEDPPEACTQSSSSSAPDASGSGAGRGGGGQPLEDPSSPSGSGQPPSSGGGASGGSGGGSDRSGGFSAEQNEQIRSARERIAEASRGVGKYHRRTLAEQFPPDSWKQPEPVILW